MSHVRSDLDILLASLAKLRSQHLDIFQKELESAIREGRQAGWPLQDLIAAIEAAISSGV